ncbi:MAG: tripartite tricarboxylate transporter TctB family protein [Rhodobiaceae bacterium]|nr:tripartite tricarboxylate transporter TctB family protein [Rhodobiaceae bacterium]
MSRRAQENIVVCLFIGIFVAAIVMAAGYGPRARVVPLPIATIGVILAVLQLILQNLPSAGDLRVDTLEMLTGRKKSEVAGVEVTIGKDPRRWRREVIAVGFVVLLTAMVVVIGPLSSAFLFSAGYLMLKRQFSLPMNILFAGVFTLVIYVLFVLVLDVQMNRSLMGPILGF